MKILAWALVTLGIGPLAWAGDGGYSVYSCVSSTGRTVLSIFMDNYSLSSNPYAVTLIVDGQSVKYTSGEKSADSVTYDYDTGVLAVRSAGVDALKVKLKEEQGARASATVLRGYRDPRIGTVVEPYIGSASDIQLDCRVYFQEP